MRAVKAENPERAETAVQDCAKHEERGQSQ